jgi:hypothetical protein
VIDLGGDAGMEVFEASTTEELIDKIAEAKRHATKKIREQEAELNRLRAEQPKEKEFTPDEEYAFSQELLAKPTAAFKKLFKTTTGYSIEEFATAKERIDALVNGQQKSDAINSFLTTHSDYVDSDRNGLLMQKWMGNNVSAESFEKAYQDLKQSGLLELKGEEAHVGQDSHQPSKTRIEDKSEEVVPPQQTRKASSISTRGRTAPVIPSSQSSEDDPYSMPMEKLRELANRQLAGKQ